jgi:hypothetical protein
MSEGSNGYGPPGARYPHSLFVHHLKSTPVGTELTLILDDDSVSKLMVSFPPQDTEWTGKFLSVVDPGPPSLRTCSVLVPMGQPIAAFRPLDSGGNAMEHLCCMYRIVQGDWLRDLAPKSTVPELATPEEQIKEQNQEVNQRLYMQGASQNCCVCGNIYAEASGYKFSQLGREELRTIKLLTGLSESFPFICGGCYKKHFGGMGALGAQAMGSMSLLEGNVAQTILVFVRAYILSILVFNCRSHPTNESIMFTAVIGSYLPFEQIPRAMIAAIFKNPLMMMGLVFVPVTAIAMAAVRPDLAMEIYAEPSRALAIFGLQDARWLRGDVAEYSFYGALATVILGLVAEFFGFVPSKQKKEKAPRSH